MVTKTKSTPKAEKAAKPAAPKAAAPVAGQPVEQRASMSRRPTMVGVVVSDKMQKTIVVKVERRVKHGLYGKYLVRSTRYKAHDEKNTAKTGDLVSLVQTRPMSKDKRWALQNIVRRGNQIGALEIV